MTKDVWLVAGGFALQVAGPDDLHFRAVEVADVGRQKKDHTGKVIATLQAPGIQEVRNALILIDVLEWGRAYDGVASIDVNSWFRDQVYNLAIGGVGKSVHQTGGAGDHNKRDWSPLKLALAYHRHHPDRDKLGIGYYPPNPEKKTRGFVHLDVRGLLPEKVRATLGGYPARWSPTEPDWHHV